MWCRAESPRKSHLAWRREERQPTAKEILQLLRRHKMSVVVEDAIDKGVIPKRDADRVVAEYRRFLALHVAHCRANILVGGFVDAFWHHHLLFTENYAQMCVKAQCGFIHHRPPILERGKPTTVLTNAGIESLYTSEYGVALPWEIWR